MQKVANKIVQAIQRIGQEKNFKFQQFLGWIALVAVQELLKSKVRGSGRNDDNILRIDGNADNYIELNDFLERNPQLKNSVDETSSELEMLIYVAQRLLKYGS
tara:strand:- start:108 stop:416 length:309 start_codon:yes stop_codon:yes gene_type:complete